MTGSDRIYEALAYVIRLHRLNAGKSQPDVYESAVLTAKTYRRLEDNEGPVSVMQLEAIAAVFGMQGSELLQEAEAALERGSIPKLPASKRAWRRTFGFEP